MGWANDLATILADCYEDQYDRFADRVSIKNLDSINKRRGPIDVWFDIVKLAKREGKLEKLVDEVIKDYSNLNQELLKILDLAFTQDVPQTEDYPVGPLAVAQYVVSAILEHDEERFLRCLTPDAARELAEFIAERPSLWWFEWQEWADDIIEVRYEYDRLAYARCGDKDDGYDRYFVMELALQGGRWLCSDMQYCPIDSWDEYYLEPPTGPTVLEILDSFLETSTTTKEKFNRIIAALPDIGEVIPYVVDVPLNPPLVIVDDWKSEESSNAAIVSYSQACAPSSGSSMHDEYNPLSSTDILHALYWIEPTNHEYVPWIIEKGKWHDPDLSKKLETYLNIYYLVIHRLVSPRIPGALGKAGDFGIPVTIEGVIFDFKQEIALGAYRVEAISIDSDSLFKLMKRKLLDEIQRTTKNTFIYESRWY